MKINMIVNCISRVEIKASEQTINSVYDSFRGNHFNVTLIVVDFTRTLTFNVNQHYLCEQN